MREEKRTARARQIETAAYAVLDQKGYEGMSMLAVARASKASNETLYRWYGDKTGLFRALITRNTETVRTALDSVADGDALHSLRQVGPRLLSMLLGPRAVALNRAAAADATGTLGQALAQAGRESVAPWITALMQRASKDRQLGNGTPQDMAETYFSLLIGDSQIRRVTGAMPEPDDHWFQTRSDQALARLQILFPPPSATAAR